MPSSRSELDAMLDELGRDLRMVVMDATDQDDVWTAFATQADAIEAKAGAADLAHVRARMDAILAENGIQASVSADKRA